MVSSVAFSREETGVNIPMTSESHSTKITKPNKGVSGLEAKNTIWNVWLASGEGRQSWETEH